MLRSFPLVRFVFAFALGIILWNSFFNLDEFHHFTTVFFVCAILMIIGQSWLLQKFRQKKSFLLPEIVGLLILVFLGFTRSNQIAENHFEPLPTGKRIYQFEVIERPRETEKYWKCAAQVIFFENDSSIKRSKSKVFLFIPKDSLQKSPITFASTITAQTHLTRIPNIKHDWEFDNFTFMGRKGIFYNAFLQKNQFSVEAPTYSLANFCVLFAEQVRDAADVILRKQIKESQSFTSPTLHFLGISDYFSGITRTDEEANLRAKAKIDEAYAVGTALFLGIKDSLDEDTLRNYSVSGAMHVLAVSGLHVAFLLQMMTWLLVRLLKMNKESKLFIFTILLLVWFYALLTGFSPSVVRASMMFSFVLIGKSGIFHKSKKVSTYNTIAASALFMLFYDPFWLFDVGFLLSYIAVIGIIYYQPKIYAWRSFENKFLDLIWVLVSVSLAAQLATLPLTLYYFHQFPTYFLLTNVAIINLSSLALGAIMLCFFTFFIPYLGDLVAFLCKISLISMNLITDSIEELPDSLYADISLNLYEVILMTFAILAFTFFIERKKIIHFAFFVFSIIALCISSFYKDFQATDKKQIAIYSGKKPAILFSKGHDAVLISENAANTVKKQNLGHILTSRIKFISDDTTKIPAITFPFGKLYAWENLRILHLKKMPPKNFALDCDWVLVSNNALYKGGLPDALNPKKIIFDASNSFYFIEKALIKAQERHLHTHVIREQGAYIAQIQ